MVRYSLLYHFSVCFRWVSTTTTKSVVVVFECKPWTLKFYISMMDYGKLFGMKTESGSYHFWFTSLFLFIICNAKPEIWQSQILSYMYFNNGFSFLRPKRCFCECKLTENEFINWWVWAFCVLAIIYCLVLRILRKFYEIQEINFSESILPVQLNFKIHSVLQ